MAVGLFVCFLRVVKSSLESDPSRRAAPFLTASCPARPLRAAGAGPAVPPGGAVCRAGLGGRAVSARSRAGRAALQVSNERRGPQTGKFGSFSAGSWRLRGLQKQQFGGLPCERLSSASFHRCAARAAGSPCPSYAYGGLNCPES